MKTEADQESNEGVYRRILEHFMKVSMQFFGFSQFGLISTW